MAEEVIKAGGTPHYPEGVAVVVGGSGGIGRGCCERLAAHGANVALTYRSNKAKADDAVAAVEAAGRKGHAAPLDLADRDAVQRYFDDVAERFGAIHTVVFAVGADITMAYVGDIDADEWERTIDGDLNGFYRVFRASLPHLRKQGGSYVALTSAGIPRHPPRDILSTVPKAGIEALVRGIAREEGRYGIRANAIQLGVIDAGLFDRIREQVSDKFVEAMKNNTALRRFASAHEVGDAAVYLSSSVGSFITGHSLLFDGGYAV